MKIMSLKDVDFVPDKMTQTQLAMLKNILTVAHLEEKFIFLKGGWNIDVSYGKPTRQHDDIDFHFNRVDTEFWRRWFLQNGYTLLEDDGWTMRWLKNDVPVDFEAFEQFDKHALRWKHGHISPLYEVIDTGVFEGIPIMKMKIQVEQYLKEQHVNLRPKDIHDLAVIGLLRERENFSS